MGMYFTLLNILPHNRGEVNGQNGRNYGLFADAFVFGQRVVALSE
jgi:hypothetical protein